MATENQNQNQNQNDKQIGNENRNQNLETISNIPLLSEIFPHNLSHWPSKVHFKGWKFPQRKWKEWVDRLAGKYAAVWNQANICDAILSSIYQVPSNHDIVLGLSEFWSVETNTFLFPWGEATLTLEDIMILGGLPVIGEPVNTPPNEEMKKIAEEMERQRSEICKTKTRKAAHSVWITQFMDDKSSELEHIGFLSLWLSRFIFPSFSEETIGKHVFPIAVKLSHGKRVALGPAVLSRIYYDLGFMRDEVLDSKETISLTGPFQLLQLWAFEHFPSLGPKIPNVLTRGEPRIAHWHKVISKVTHLPIVRSVLRLEENFQWRPYASDLKNWRHMSFYAEFQQILCDNSSLDYELRSFCHCFRACELVGLDCKEKYLPYRVAMQFGLNQDLPAHFKNLGQRDGFSIPARTYKPQVTERYAIWWKNMMALREKAVKVALLEKRYANILKSLSPTEVNESKNDFPDSRTLPRVSIKLKIPYRSSNNKPKLSNVLSSCELEKDIGKSVVEIKANEVSYYDEDLPLSERREYLRHISKSRKISSNLLSAKIGNENERKRKFSSKIEGFCGEVFEFIGSKSLPSGGTNVEEGLATTQSRTQKIRIKPSPVSGKSITGETKETILPIKKIRTSFIKRQMRHSSLMKKNIGSYGNNDTQKPHQETKGNLQSDPLDFIVLSERIKPRKADNKSTITGKLDTKTASENGRNNLVHKESVASQFLELDLEGKVQMLGNLLGLN